ncbi:MAG: hypothetical protein HZA90_26230 [Verrucomicrobia bacterium]|nr:hypothetical protein [Verrucomicrobiota bacterium]
MTKPVEKSLSFAAMALVVFSGMTLLVWGGISTGPHTYFQLGLTGWLTLHRYRNSWSLDRVEPVLLVVELGLAMLLTWILARVFDWVKSARRKTMT